MRSMTFREVPTERPIDAAILASLQGLVPVGSGDTIRLMPKQEVMDRLEELRQAGEGGADRLVRKSGTYRKLLETLVLHADAATMQTRMAMSRTIPIPDDIFSRIASFGNPGGWGVLLFTNPSVILMIFLPVG